MLHNEIDIGPIRPPSEGGSHSLLIRASRNCPWNRCTFCYGLSYNREKFQVRSVDDIKKDIDRVAEVKRQIEKAAANGNDGKINHDLFREMNRRQEDWTSGHTFTSVYSWLMTGGKTVFLQDADSLVMKTDHDVAALHQFPGNGLILPDLLRLIVGRPVDIDGGVALPVIEVGTGRACFDKVLGVTREFQH